MNKNIFTITTFQHIGDVYLKDGKSFKHRGSRTVGYMHDKQKAIQLVLNNTCDLNEGGYYPYALVEEVPEGIYGIDSELSFEDRVTWFAWCDDSNSYKIIDKCPDDLDNKIGFSLG